MNRAALFIVLIVSAMTAVTFGLFPQIDIEISHLFFTRSHEFALAHDAWLTWARRISMWVVAALALLPIVALGAKMLKPKMRMPIRGRAVVFLLATFVLGPGLLVNTVLKEEWGRSRPGDVQEFGGSDQFVAWWNPDGRCTGNCSFVSGEGSAAFWTPAPAVLAPAPLRPLAYVVAIAFGASVGMLRIAFGGHFFTDVAFSGVLTFLVIYVTHALLYRWPASRISDDAIEYAIETAVLSIHVARARAIGCLGSARRGFNRAIGRGPPDNAGRQK